MNERTDVSKSMNDYAIIIIIINIIIIIINISIVMVISSTHR